MTQPSHVRVLAQRDPIGPLTTQLGELVENARTQVDRLSTTLRQLDEIRATLREQESVEITVDLGDVGNAAAVARRQVADGKASPTFRLPRA